MPTFAYEFNDDAAPARYAPLPVATHTSELPYLFDLPNAPLQVPLNADQQQLAASMRAAWAHFAATGNPSTRALRVAVVPPRRAGRLARDAAATARHRVRGAPPLLVLGRMMTREG